MEKNFDVCPFCGGTKTIEGVQSGYGKIFRSNKLLSFGKPLYHVICLDCGAVIRSYIKDPQDWA